MMIPWNILCACLNAHNIKINGVLHIGAHECEELDDYLDYGLAQSDIIWIDALEEKVNAMKEKGIENVFYNVISDKPEHTKFYVTNNYCSSSLLQLGTHSNYFPEVIIKEERDVKTTTLENFFNEEKLDPKKYNFWNLDIQGAELNALKGGSIFLEYVDAIYIEVNTEEVYKNCATLEKLEEFLKSKGFLNVAMYIIKENYGDALYVKHR